MKYKQKYLDKVYKNPITNFSEIIDISVYFDNVGELDYSSEAIAAIESIEPIKISNLLIEELKNRKKEDFDNYGYQAIWWALLNSGGESVYNNIALNMTIKLKTLFVYWIEKFLEEDDEPYIAINKIFKSLNMKGL